MSEPWSDQDAPDDGSEADTDLGEFVEVMWCRWRRVIAVIVFATALTVGALWSAIEGIKATHGATHALSSP